MPAKTKRSVDDELKELEKELKEIASNVENLTSQHKREPAVSPAPQAVKEKTQKTEKAGEKKGEHGNFSKPRTINAEKERIEVVPSETEEYVDLDDKLEELVSSGKRTPMSSVRSQQPQFLHSGASNMQSGEVKEERAEVEVPELPSPIEDLRPVSEEILRDGVDGVNVEGKETVMDGNGEVLAVQEADKSGKIGEKLVASRSIVEVEGPVFVSLTRYREIVKMLNEIGEVTRDLDALIREMKSTRSKGVEELEKCVEHLQRMEERVETLIKIMRI